MDDLRTRLLLGAAIAAALLLAGCDKPETVSSSGAAPTAVGEGVVDTVVTAKLRAALDIDADIRGFGLGIETRNGAVQLRGFVDNQEQVERVMAMARTIVGVKSVENRLAIRDSSQPSGGGDAGVGK